LDNDVVSMESILILTTASNTGFIRQIYMFTLKVIGLAIKTFKVLKKKV